MSGPRRIRLLVTTGTLPAHDNDGEPRFVADLANAMQRHMDVSILAPAHANASQRRTVGEVPVIRYSYAPLRTLERIAYPGGLGPRLKRYPAMWALVPGLLLGLRSATAKLLREERFDCVHCHWAIPQGFIQSTLTGAAGRLPYVLTLHGGDIYTSRGRLRRAMVGSAIKGASAVTVVSKALEREVRVRWPCPLGNEFPVIPMGCDFGAFGPEHRVDDLPADLGLEGPLILFVGRLAEKKGVGVLLEAMASEPLSTRRWSALLVGDGPLRTELQAKAGALGLGRRVRFHGAVAHRDLPPLYASADLLCVPSVVAPNGDTEGLPTVLSEACASGLPAVATTVGGIPEIIEDGVNGRLVPPGDVAALGQALAEMIDDKAERLRSGSAARSAAARFDWTVIASRFADVVSRAVATMPSRDSPARG